MRAYFGEGRRWLETTLEAAAASPARSRRFAASRSSRSSTARSIGPPRRRRRRWRWTERPETRRGRRNPPDCSPTWSRIAATWRRPACSTRSRRACSARRRRPRVGHRALQPRACRPLADDLTGAEARFEESQAIFSRLGDVMGQAASLMSLASTASERGEHARAFALLVQATELFVNIGHVAGKLDAWRRSPGCRRRWAPQPRPSALGSSQRVLSGEVGREPNATRRGRRTRRSSCGRALGAR